MKKVEIIKEIATQKGIETATVETVLEAFMTSVKEHTLNKEYVSLSGFGRFGIKKMAAKVGRNISKNTPIHIPEQCLPAFKPSKKFTQKVKNALSEVE
ncbi:MAG: HU family DNA-binding protein [Bacteroidia bacterium]